MCLIGIAFRSQARYPLMVAANRDEFHARPAAPAHFWPDGPELLAGRDLEAGGAWLGLSLSGRFAAVTNYREPAAATSGRRSRGELVADFLEGSESASAYCHRVGRAGNDYGGFSLLVMDGSELWFLSNRGDGPCRVPPGVHGLSNRELDSPWPKVRRIRETLDAETRRPSPRSGRLFAALMDRRTPPDDDLPDTGVGLERERLLGPAFVSSQRYGTRCATVIRVDADGRAGFGELTFDAAGRTVLSRGYGFRLHRRPAMDDAGRTGVDNARSTA